MALPRISMPDLQERPPLAQGHAGHYAPDIVKRTGANWSGFEQSFLLYDFLKIDVVRECNIRRAQ
jgi:hypothetical protein